MDDFVTGQVVYHRVFGAGRIVNVEVGRIAANFVRGGVKQFNRDAASVELSETAFDQDQDDRDLSELKEAIREVLLEEGLIGETELADK